MFDPRYALLLFGAICATSATDYPVLDDSCYTVKWEDSNTTDNWGNCFKMVTDDTHRYITTNQVPDYYFGAYCPIGLGLGYCVQAEIDKGMCMFPNLTCGEDNGPGSSPFGDVWVPQKANYKIPLKGNPTRSDRPYSMYDASKVGAEKTVPPATGVAINGIAIQGPTDAGDVSIDLAGFELPCGGHVTPPLGSGESSLFPKHPQADATSEDQFWPPPRPTRHPPPPRPTRGPPPTRPPRPTRRPPPSRRPPPTRRPPPPSEKPSQPPSDRPYPPPSRSQPPSGRPRSSPHSGRPYPPPMSGSPPPSPSGGPPGIGGPPLYHYHKAADCLMPFRNASIEISAGGKPKTHAQLMGYALDGFGIYAYQDIHGAAPVVDECGGHFGPVDTGEVVYHYHAKTYVPYYLACQGPALGNCKSTQGAADYCGSGCGAEVCVQPGTTRRGLEDYLNQWDDGWLSKYTVNNFEIDRKSSAKRVVQRSSRTMMRKNYQDFLRYVLMQKANQAHQPNTQRLSDIESERA